jgi:pimeloyl-ACP methyl ester carboxylesterase
MTRQRLAVLAFAFAAAAGGVAHAGRAEETPGAPRPCRLGGLPHEVRCGVLARPLDPARPDGTHIDLHYVVVPATALHKSEDPVFFFAGGPGQSAIGLAPRVMAWFARLSRRRDVVFIDQRGTGRSAPLECARDDALPLAERIDVDGAIARLRDCRRRLEALPHGDLRQYTTAIAMTDAEAVRAVLGAPRVNLVGGSYGTRAALEYLRQFPHRVRRVVIDGVAPPDMALPESQAMDAQAALDALFAGCEAEPGCRVRHPGLAARWRVLLEGLPTQTSVVDPVSGAPTAVTLTRDAVAAAVRAPLYAPAFAAALPFAIGEALAGRYTPLAGLAGSLDGGSRAGEVAQGMHFAVTCAEDASRLAETEPPGLGAAFLRPYREVCADWPRATLPPGFRSLPRSPAAVLAFSGTLDPVTPPRHAERVVRALGEVGAGGLARNVVVPNAGHGVLGVGCASDVMQRFVDAESDAEALAVDAGCLMRLPRPPAFEPARPQAAGSAPR